MTELATILSKLSPIEIETALKEAQVIREENLWPHYVNLAIRRDTDSNYDVAADLGLSLEAQGNFRHTGTEITLTTAIYEDGSAYATAIKCGENRLELSSPLRI